MLECNRYVRKKITLLTRVVALLLPIVCVILLLSQTAFAKNTYLINDGDRVVIHTTYATDPAAVLDEAGLQLGEDDTYTTQEGLGMSEITIQRKQMVSIAYGDKTLVVSSYGETVESLLTRMNFNLTTDDAVSHAMNAATYDGMVITISRTLSTEEVYTVSVPYNTTYCYDASLAEGEERVLTKGVEGQIQYTASVLYVDGKEISRTVLSQQVLTQAVDALIAIGSHVDAPEYPKPTEPKPTEPKPTEPKPTEPKPTVPETQPAPTPEAPPVTNFPIIGENTITTPDGEVLTYTGSMQAIATAYNNQDPGCTIYTAIGTLCRVGAIAVDPKVIPYGTRMYIHTNDGKYIYGIAVAEDCGGSIKGNRVDLYFDTVEECNTFGIRACTVYFLG